MSNNSSGTNNNHPTPNTQKNASTATTTPSPTGGTKVTLHVYDLSGGMARQFSQAFIGKQLEGIWYVRYASSFCPDRSRSNNVLCLVTIQSIGPTFRSIYNSYFILIGL